MLLVSELRSASIDELLTDIGETRPEAGLTVRDRPVALSGLPVLLAGLMLGALLVGSLLRQSGNDPFVFAAISSEQDFPRDYIEAELGRTVVTRPGLGHDGQSFVLQAQDPFYRDLRTLKVDNPIYRGQRLVYPLLAGLGGIVPLRLIPWGMIAVQILTFGFGAWATGEAAASMGLNRWWGLAFPLNPGTWAALQVGGSSGLALAFGIAAVVAVHRNRLWSAAFLLAVSALTREVMLAMAAGLFLQHWRRSGRWSLQLIALPGVLSVAWGVYLRLQIEEVFPASGGALAFPFAGLGEALIHWAKSPVELIFGILTLIAAIAVVAAAVATKDLLAAASAPFAFLLALLAIGVLRQNFDYSRAVIPLYTAVALVAANRLSGNEAWISPKIRPPKPK